MQIRKPRLCVSMSGPVTDLPPFQVEPQFLEALWRELRCAGASLEARDRALWELRILLLRFRQAPKKGSGPRTKHRDEAGAILRAMNAAIDEVVGSGNRARGRYFLQIGKCLVDADQKAVGKQTFKVVMKMFSKAATASLRQAQSRVSRGRLPDRPELSALVAHAAYLWQKYTNQKFVATNHRFSNDPVVGAQIRFVDLLMEAAGVKDLKAATRHHLIKKALNGEVRCGPWARFSGSAA